MVVTGDRADGCSVWTSDLATKKMKKKDLAKQKKGNSWKMSKMNAHLLRFCGFQSAVTYFVLVLSQCKSNVTA